MRMAMLTTLLLLTCFTQVGRTQEKNVPEPRRSLLEREIRELRSKLATLEKELAGLPADEVQKKKEVVKETPPAKTGEGEKKKETANVPAATLKEADAKAEKAIKALGGQVVWDGEKEKVIVGVFFRGKISDGDLKELSVLDNLQRLSLENTKVTDSGIKELTRHKGLQVIFLTQTSVTDAGLKHLSGLTNLKTVNVTGTTVTAAGAETLRKALPKCTVIR